MEKILIQVVINRFARLTIALATLVFHGAASQAMVGNAPPAPAALARHMVMITHASGGYCTGTVIARDLVLTAGHCGDPNDVHKLIQFSPSGQTVFLDVVRAVRHPQFDLKAYLNHRATADVAVLKLAQPLPASYAPAPLAPAEKRFVVGDRLIVAGFGLSVIGDGRTGGTLRAATLTVTGQPGTLQIRLVDPAGNNKTFGMGTCNGDSGAPAFDSTGAVVGVVSWATAPNNEDGCGGLTGITPLPLYRVWIVEMMRKFSTP